MKLEYVDLTYIDPKDSLLKKLKSCGIRFLNKDFFLLRTTTGDVKYSLFAKIVQFIITLPFGTACVEIGFKKPFKRPI
jgi:hypothetical protein